MKKREDYTRLITLALLLSVGILVAFQVYRFREGDRIQSVKAADQAQQIARGQELFADNCATCHGSNGEGDIGPALNSKKFLDGTEDGRISSLISSGVPGTAMPSWLQDYGGPFTAEQIQDLVGFIRNWQATAQDIAKPSPTADASQGRVIFASTCYACHGANGEGTDRAPALNSKDLLDKFDDNWFRQTISDGRPAKGMPTWGKVLSPEQINSVVAFIRGWQATAPLVQTPVTLATPVTSPTSSAAATAAPTEQVARPSNGNLTGGAALNLTGAPTNGAQVFVASCQKCHGPQGTGGVSNPGSTDGTIPPLNPIDSTLVNSDLKLFAYNVDLFVEHGSTPDGPNPAQVMPAWGDTNKLTPQQIADVIAFVMGLNPPAAAPTASPTTSAPATSAPTEQVARPSNGNLTGGAALNLTGAPTNGQPVFVASCQKCHGPQGTGGVNNPGSTDGTIPPLNPIDSTLVNSDPKLFAYNVDLFVEHGSTPDGPNPAQVMPAWGDTNKLTPQQIADVIAYVMGLNPPAAAPTASPTTSAPATSAPTEQVARPSNGNLTGGAALNLTGAPTNGQPVFVASCQKCHGPQGTGGVNNPGSTDGTIPPLNPIDSTLVNSDLKLFAYNVDLFVEHGSTPDGPNPAQVMPAWGDTNKLTPQQIADVIAYVMGLNPPAAAPTASPTTSAAATAAPTEQVARPSNSNLTGGAALNLAGDPTNGTQVFVASCQKCHGPQGTGGVNNPGSTDGTIPPLNPIDSTLVNSDLKLFAYNVDLFVEHGSTPDGPNPAQVMPAWGDTNKLTPQQIADVIAYILSLNR